MKTFFKSLGLVLTLTTTAVAAPINQGPVYIYQPLGGSSGGGGTGCVPTGSAGNILVDSGAGTCGSDTATSLSSGALSLGSSGVAGSLTFGNATSGTLTLQTDTGALGTVTATLPTNTGTLAELNLAQSWPAIQTFTTPVINGTVSGTGVSQSSSASTLAQRDANSNLFSNNFLASATLTVGAGGTTTLTAASSRYQALNTAAQTYVLPDATTLSLGPWFAFNNNSSGTLTINKNGGALQYSVPAGGVAQCGPTNIGTAAGTWDCHAYIPPSASWGTGVTGLQMNNVLSTTAQIGAGAASSTSPVFIPQRGTSTTGYSGDSTHLYGVIGGTTSFTADATSFTMPSAIIGAGSAITSSGAGGALGTGAFASAYTLPTATASVLGGVKPDGTTITNTAGAISVTYGTAANTAAQGNDSRITGAAQQTHSGTTWTPADASGAGLTFTSVSAVYNQIGTQVFVYVTLLYPSTSDTNATAISGLPVAIGASQTAGVVGSCRSTGAIGVQIYSAAGATTVNLTNPTTGAAITNADMTGSRVVCSLSYLSL